MEKLVDHFSAGVIFANNPKDGKWYVLGASVISRLKKGGKSFEEILKMTDVERLKMIDGVKIPGGTNHECQWESPLDTLIRESKEENLLDVSKATLVYSKDVQGRIPGNVHTKNFYLVEKFEGKFPIDFIHKFSDDEDVVLVKWWGLEEFEKSLFSQHHKDGFRKAFLKMTEKCEQFGKDNAKMFARYKVV